MSVVRKDQPGITRVLPHAQNRRYACPETWGAELIGTGDSWAQRFTNWEDASEYGYTLRYEGVGGATIFDTGASQCITLLIDGILATWPDATHCVICTGGVNDMTRRAQNLNSLTLTDMQNGIVLLADKIVAAGMVPILCDIPQSSFWNGEPAEATARQLVNDYSPWLANYCAANNYPFIPILGRFCDDTEILERYRAVDGADPLHLNADGYAILMGMIRQAMKTGPGQATQGSGPMPEVGFQFDGTVRFVCDTFTIDPSTDNYIYVFDFTAGDFGGINRDFWGTVNQANYFRARAGTDDIRGSYGGVANNAGTINWVQGLRSDWVADCSVVNQMTVGTSGQSETIVVGSAAGSSILEIGGRTGGANTVGILWRFTIFASDGVTVVQRWLVDEGAGNTITSEQGEVATLNGAGGGWVTG